MQTSQSEIAREAEVDFIYLARAFWDGKQMIGKSILISLAIGLMVALMLPNEYTASCTMVPQVTDPKSKLGSIGGMSGLSGLAAMAGINITTGAGSDLSPRTYANIITSPPFELELMKTKLNFEKLDSAVTLYDYYTKIKSPNLFLKYTVGLPGVIIRAIKGEPRTMTASEPNAIYQFSEKQIEIKKNLEKQVQIVVNDKDGYVTISCALPEAYASAQLTRRVQTLLQQYITEFKIEKAKQDLVFIEDRYQEAKKNYQTAQRNLAQFRDQNKNVSLAIVKTQEEQLSGEYTLVTGVYSEMAKKLENARIQVKEETPVFTVVSPVSVPDEKSFPNRPLVLAISAFIGFILGCVWIIGKSYLTETRNKWLKSALKENKL